MQFVKGDEIFARNLKYDVVKNQIRYTVDDLTEIIGHDDPGSSVTVNKADIPAKKQKLDHSIIQSIDDEINRNEDPAQLLQKLFDKILLIDKTRRAIDVKILIDYIKDSDCTENRNHCLTSLFKLVMVFFFLDRVSRVKKMCEYVFIFSIVFISLRV